MTIYRRDLFPLLLLQSHRAFAGPPLGGEQWSRRFRDFMKELNEFVIELNDDKLDERKWKRVCQAWSAIEEP
jgi:hypothetical protein